MAVRTDLHTHFAGVLSPDELIEVGLEHNVSLDVATAKRLQLVSANYSGAPLPLAALSERQMATLKAGLKLSPEKQNLFDSLDEVYANRAFIAKDQDLFIPLLEKIAQSYEKQGVSYAELSYAGVINNPQLLKAIHANMPRIEAETGVKLRFLGAMWRHSDPEWNMDEVDRLKGVLKSPYVVGFDVMGHEKNPIREMKEPLEDLVGYAAKNIPHCVARLHAGENPYYSAEPSSLDDYSFNNAYESIKIPDKARKDESGAFLGTHGKDVQIRLGHGRYGLHPDTLKLGAETGTISELCLKSNLLLNHADNFAGPFNLYAGKGVPFTLGSDGYGLYDTSMPEEYATAVKAGMTPAARKILEKTEDGILEKDGERFALKTELWKKHELECAARGADPFVAVTNPAYDTPDGKQRWTREVTQARKEAELAKQGALLSSLEGMGVHTDADSIDHLLKEHSVYLFAGGSKTSWPTATEEQRAHATAEMKKFIDTLDGRKDVVMTGGTDFGFEAVIHKLVEERNAALPPEQKIPVVAALTMEANIKQIRPGTISHAMVLKYGDGLAKSWMDQPSALMDLVTRTDAKVIMAGGGQVIRDMAIDAAGRGLINDGNVLLFAEINGASGEKAKDYPHASFHSADELQTLLSSAGSAKRMQSPSLATTDILRPAAKLGS